MIEQIFKELEAYQERMRKKSKALFREYVFQKAQDLGYDVNIIPKSIWSKNVVVGNLNQAKVVIGAHYDTPPRLFSWMTNHLLLFNIGIVLIMAIIPPLLMNLIDGPLGLGLGWGFIAFMFLYLMGVFAVPNRYNLNDNTSGVLAVLTLMHELKHEKVAFVFFDNEEKGLFGSLGLANYLKKQRKKMIVLDCIGQGNLVSLQYYRRSTLANGLMEQFKKLQGSIEIETSKGGYLMTSDHMSFIGQEHVGIFCFTMVNNKKKILNVHSHKDRVIDLENIIFVCSGIKEYVGDMYGTH